MINIGDGQQEQASGEKGENSPDRFDIGHVDNEDFHQGDAKQCQGSVAERGDLAAETDGNCRESDGSPENAQCLHSLITSSAPPTK